MNSKLLNKKINRSLFQTITKMIPAVLTALVATALGFIALYSSPVPMIQDFGKMLTVGMIVSFFVGIFILIPIIVSRDKFFTNEKKSKKEKKTKQSFKVERLLESFTLKIISLRWIILALAFLLAGLGIWVDLDAGVETDIETFMPQDTQELIDIHKLRDIIGTTDQVSIIYKGENVLDEESLKWVDNVTTGLENEFLDVVVQAKSVASILRQLNEAELPGGTELTDILEGMPHDQMKLLVNDDSTKGVITVGIKHLEAGELKDFIESLISYLEQNQAPNINTTITGKSVLDVEMVTALTTGRYKMTLLGMGYVFIGLLFIYRHPVKAFIPLLPIIMIVGWSGAVMYAWGIKYTPLTATLGALIIGIGTEFTILIMERFYEERKKGYPSKEAIIITNRKTGKAIFASAFTTIGGFSALLISDFVILSNFGMITLINIFLALFSSIVVMPVILILLDIFVKTKTHDLREVQINAG